MPVTITKKTAKAKTKGKVVDATSVIEVIAARYVDNRLALEAKLAKLAALQKEVENDEKELLAYTDMLVSPSEGHVMPVGEYVVKIGAKGRKAVAIDNAAIKAELGEELFDQIATFKIEDLHKYLTGVTFDKAVTYANVNKRKVVIEEAQPNP